MALKNWPVFKAGIFKQAKYLVNAPQKAGRVLEILETGTVGVEFLPMQTGFVTAAAPGCKKAFAYMHSLKFQIYENGKPTNGESVIVISERSYYPLDPLNSLKATARAKLASLGEIAKVKHAQARAIVGGKDNFKDLALIVVQGSFIILGIYAAVALFRGC